MLNSQKNEGSGTVRLRDPLLYAQTCMLLLSSTCIKDAGIAIRHSQGRILFYTAGSRNGLERVVGDGPRGWTSGDADTKRKLYPRKIHVFCYGKIVEDARQEEKDVPDLLEAIMRPTCLVKEELRPILFKITKFKPEITKIRV